MLEIETSHGLITCIGVRKKNIVRMSLFSLTSYPLVLRKVYTMTALALHGARTVGFGSTEADLNLVTIMVHYSRRHYAWLFFSYFNVSLHHVVHVCVWLSSPMYRIDLSQTITSLQELFLAIKGPLYN